MRSPLSFFIFALICAVLFGNGCQPASKEKSISDYIASLRNGNYLKRVAAAKALSEKVGPEDAAAVEPLSRALKDQDESIRIYAVKALGRIGDPEALPIIIEATRDPSSYVRYEAVMVLDLFPDPRSIDALRKSLRDESSHVRYAACQSLGDLKAAGTFHHLIFALKDESSYVRSSAALALAKLGDSSAVPALEQNLTDPNEWVRNSAALALHELGSVSGISVLIDNLSSETADKGGKVRAQAVEYLRRLSGQNFGFDPDASAQKRQPAVVRWKDWARKRQVSESAPAGSGEKTGPGGGR